MRWISAGIIIRKLRGRFRCKDGLQIMNHSLKSVDYNIINGEKDFNIIHYNRLSNNIQTGNSEW